MTELFIKEHWVALISLLIALFGGASGIIAIINYFRQKSNFKYTLAGIVLGESADNHSCMLLLSGTISNSGDKPLVPTTFDLEVKIGKNWNKMSRRVIPNNLKLGSDEINITVDKPWEKDLLKLKISVTQPAPAYGFLMFTNKTLKKEAFMNTKVIYKLICIDTFGKKYSTKFSKIDKNIGEGLTFPKNDMTVQPKK